MILFMQKFCLFPEKIISFTLFFFILAMPVNCLQYIREHLEKYVDKNVSPCDNFFAHVCPTNIREEDTPLGRINGNSKKLMDLLNTLIPISELEDETNMDFFRNLRQHLALMIYLNVESFVVSPREELGRIAETVIAQVKKTFPLSEKAVSDLTHTVYRNNYFSGFININQTDLMRVYETLNRIYRVAKRKSGSEFAAHLIEEIAESLHDFNPPLGVIIDAGLKTETVYYPDLQVSALFDAYYLVSVKEDPAVKYGATYSMVGHEMFHPIFNKINGYSEFGINGILSEELALVSNKKCLVNHMKRIYNEYRKDELNDSRIYESGSNTYMEDGPDLEGLQAAYLTLFEMGINMTEFPYPTLNMTRRELFFYSYASSICHDAKTVYRNGNEDHSPIFARVLGPLTLSSAFIETFGCTPRTRMGRIYVILIGYL